MLIRALRPSRRHPALRPAALLFAALVLALILPRLLDIEPAARLGAAFALLAMFVLGGGAMRLATRPPAPVEPDVDAPETGLLDLLRALPLGVLVVAEGRVLEANEAACAQLALDAATLQATEPATLFEREADAAEALTGTGTDRPMPLRRGEATYEAHVAVRPVRLAQGPALLLLLTDMTESGRITARLDHQREELRTLARRLMTVQEDERAALSRELHDDIGQAITAIKLCASSLLHEPEPVRRAVVVETADEIAQIADQTVAKLRDLSLLLRPPQLDVLGLEAALRWQAGALFRGDAPAITLEVPSLPCRPARAVELACFRIAQEALTNVLRHAQASRVTVRLGCDGERLRLCVVDDGHGMPAEAGPGLGLVTMRERAEQLGGWLRIDAAADGGTRVLAELPLNA